MKFLLPLLALALTTTGWAQIDDPHFKTVDEATNKSVREFFKHYEQLYNLHKAHELAAYFGDGGVMHPPRRRIHRENGHREAYKRLRFRALAR
jgi:hypothetical protein